MLASMLTRFQNIDFICVSAAPLADAIQSSAESWVASIGELLNVQSRELLFKLDEEITTYWNHLHKDPSTLEDLKFVLETISNIQARYEECSCCRFTHHR